MEDSQSFVDLQGESAAGDQDTNHPMAELLASSFGYRELHHGDIIEGTVVHVAPTEILIDIGSKSEGVLSGRELEKMSADARGEIQVGQKVLAYVLNPEDKGGNVVLSLSHAQLERDWRDAEKMFKAGDIFSCKVSGYNKGGLIAHIGKVRGFIPASQLISVAHDVSDEAKRADELANMVGEELQLKIIEVDRKRNRLILSQRAAVRETRQEQREKLLSHLAEGMTARGKVSNLCEFGAFVNLGGADGLIHISELSWGRVSHPSEVLSVGDEIDVFVLNVEPDRQRIGLSLKRLQPEPWSQVQETYVLDQVVNGTVTKLTSFGAFVKLDDNIEGLIHISELADRHVNHPKEVLKEGEEISVRIIRIYPERKRIGLSLKGTEDTEVDWQDVPAEPAGQPEIDWEVAEDAVGTDWDDADAPDEEAGDGEAEPEPVWEASPSGDQSAANGEGE